MDKQKVTTFTTPILVGLLVVASFLVGVMWTKIRMLEGGKREVEEEVVQVSPTPEQPAVLGEELPTTLGNFLVTEDELCQEEEKPMVYLFGSGRCPHCTWEHPIFEKVTAKFGDLLSVHDNMDKQGADQEVWEQYSEINQGAIPFMILGCRYVRLGSGERVGEVAEEENLTALICKLTGGQPEKVCAEVKELIDQIAD